MSTHKTKIDQQLVHSFLEKRFSEPVRDLTFIEGGEGSQAFSFNVVDKVYVIRANTRNESFIKDRYAYDHFKSSAIPIPKIIEIGTLEQYHYAISEKVSGRKIDAFSEQERDTLWPRLLEVLDAIHETKIDDTAGYGKWSSTGNASDETWKSSLASLRKWVMASGETPSIFETTILEQDVWEKVYERMLALLPLCPENRYLVHGDYGFDNVFSDGTNITGVIDWGESRYGDFLYDAAWLSYWSKDHVYREPLKVYYEQKQVEIPHLHKRMRCYELHIGLGALSFYANSKQDAKYAWNKERLLALL